MTRAEMRASAHARGTPLAMMDLVLTIWIGRRLCGIAPFPRPLTSSPLP
jgi:hypothetical protein